MLPDGKPSQERQVIFMISFNLVTFIGNVGRDDPELFATKDGKPYAKFRLAVSNFSSNQDKHTTWLNVTVFGDQAERVHKVVKKGSLVLVSGKLAVNKFTGNDNSEKTAVDVTANVVE